MKQNSQLAAWEKERKIIPILILMHCKARHKSVRSEKGIRRGELCAECRELCDYSLFRLDKCPFKANKKFCSFCKVHCYKPEMRERIKAVMKYAGPRILFTHPVFAVSHVVQTVKYKKSLRKEDLNKMIEITIEVQGMKCGMCESHVNDCVRRAVRVKKVSSSHKGGSTVVVAEDGADVQAIVVAIKEQGYGVGGVSVKPYEKRGLFWRAK